MTTNLSSIVALKKYNVTRSEVEYRARETFYLNHCSDSIQDCFTSFWKVYWSGNYILQKMQNGLITRNMDAISYHVKFIDGLTRGKIIENKLKSLDKQYELSFRIPAPAFRLPAYVLIKDSNLGE